jgi:hypothetical protein
MSQLPQIDPNWSKRRHQPSEDRALPFILIASTGVLIIGVWLAKTHAQAQDEIRASAERVRAANAVAVHAQLEADRLRRQWMARSVISQPPYTVARVLPGYFPPPIDSDSARRARIQEDRRVRQQAEARLRAEQQRFAALTGQGGVPYSSAPTFDARPSNQARCAQAKADRDYAYRIVGNDRTFNFIRHWEDVVYEACKNT